MPYILKAVILYQIHFAAAVVYILTEHHYYKFDCLPKTICWHHNWVYALKSHQLSHLGQRRWTTSVLKVCNYHRTSTKRQRHEWKCMVAISDKDANSVMLSFWVGITYHVTIYSLLLSHFILLKFSILLFASAVICFNYF
jgi:hypothetical protein